MATETPNPVAPTPGPFHVTAHADGGWVIRDSLERLVARIHVSDAIREGDFRAGSPYCEDVAKANADLLAAAPRMFAALQAVFEACEGHEDGAPDASPTAKLVNSFMTQVRAAIAKAGGAA